MGTPGHNTFAWFQLGGLVAANALGVAVAAVGAVRRRHALREYLKPIQPAWASLTFPLVSLTGTVHTLGARACLSWQLAYVPTWLALAILFPAVVTINPIILARTIRLFCERAPAGGRKAWRASPVPVGSPSSSPKVSPLLTRRAVLGTAPVTATRVSSPAGNTQKSATTPAE